MTAEEKAEELFDKFNVCIPIEASFSDTGKDASRKMIQDHKATKEICLIAVEEIYKLKLMIGQHLEEMEDKENYYSFWEDVKQEINKL